VDLIVTVLEIVAPVFLLAAVGFTWVKLGFEYRIQFVTQLAMTLSVPCLIFVSLMQAKMDPAALTALTLASFIAYAAVTLAMWGVSIVVFAIMAILSFTFGIWLVSGEGALGKVVREPLVAATLLGALFLWQGWETPKFLTNTLSLIGQMAIPIMLITLGVAVARLNPRGIGKAALLSLFKLVICTGIAWLVADYFALSHVAFGVLVLQIATPVAVTSYLLAEKYGADSDAVAGLVVTSTLMAVGALPLILAVLL
jgi:predicted permease